MAKISKLNSDIWHLIFLFFFLFTHKDYKLKKNQTKTPPTNQPSSPECKKVHFINMKLDTCQNTFVLKITIHTFHFPA